MTQEKEKAALVELLEWCKKHDARIRIYKGNDNATITFNETEYIFTGIFEKGHHDLRVIGDTRPVILGGK